MFNFFQKPFGLDISDFSIEVVSLSGEVENPKLSALARRELPPGIFEGNRIFDKEKLKNFIKDSISNPEFGKIRTEKFIFSIPESKSFIYISKIPKDLKKEEILDFVKKEIKENLPLSLDEIYFDFEIRKEEILIVAALKKLVEDYLELFKNCGIHPLVLEIQSLSLARALIEKEDLVLISDIGANTTNFSLFEKKELKLSISNPIAGNEFTKAISEKLKIPLEEAEILKRECGLDPEKKGGRIFLILQKEVQELIEQIREMENYFLKKTAKKIEKIILAGGSASLPYLKEYLAENLGKEVSIGDPWLKINIDILRKKEYFEKALKIDPFLYSTAIGSALRGLEKDPLKAGINLIKGVK